VTGRLCTENIPSGGREAGRLSRRSPRSRPEHGVLLCAALLVAAPGEGLALPVFVSHFRTYPTEGSPRAPVIADLNGDHIPDLAAANFDRNSVSILLGTGDGAFADNVDFPVGTTPVSLAAGDLNGDGKLDLVTADYGSNTVSVLLGRGDGTFAARRILTVGQAPIWVTLADLDGD